MYMMYIIEIKIERQLVTTKYGIYLQRPEGDLRNLPTNN